MWVWLIHTLQAVMLENTASTVSNIVGLEPLLGHI